MYSLLLDSSNIKLCVGIAKDNTVLATKYYDAWQRQSEYMVLEIENLLKELNVAPKEINRIITTKGPGSYTGVRISLTIAKIWGFCRDIEVFAVSSLHALKDNNNPSICVINARSKRSYVGVFKNTEILKEDTILTNDELLELIKEHPDYSLCGDTQYLNLDGVESNIFKQLLDLDINIYKVEDILALKPVYLKD